MGLDMYLTRASRDVVGYLDFDLEEVKENNPNLYQKLKPYIFERGKYVHWESLEEDVGYWRKANQIHNWFVENVQNGEDDCRRYEVSKDKLEELLATCTTVITQSVTTFDKIKNGEQYKDGEWIPIYEDGKIIINPEIAEEFLPTRSGFFFGDTAYDEYYIQDLEDTIRIITEVLNTTDFDTHAVFYNSSW